MKRLLRIFLNAATVLSFALCVATVALWVGSYFVHVQLVTMYPWQLATEPGWLALDNSPEVAAGLAARRADRDFLQRHLESGLRELDRMEREFHAALKDRSTPLARGSTQLSEGFHYVRPALSPFPPRPIYYRAHLAAVFAATAVIPGCVLLRRVFSRRRRAAGLCASCGYDLRATPDRCPECGATSPPPPAALQSAAAAPPAEPARPGGAGG